MTALLALLASLFTWHAWPQSPAVFRGGSGLTLGRDDSTFSDPLAFTRNGALYNGAGGGAGTATQHTPGDPGNPIVTPVPTPGGGGQQAPDLNALQAALDAAARSGQTEAQSAMLKALGFDSIDAATAFVTAKRDEENANLSELEKREKEANEKIAAADARARDAEAAVLRSKVVSALVVAGAPAEHVNDLVDLVKVAADADDAAITAAVEERKAKFPALFTAAATPGTAAPSSTPGQQPRPGSGEASGLEAGRERARKMREAREARKPIPIGGPPSPFAPQA